MLFRSGAMQLKNNAWAYNYDASVVVTLKVDTVNNSISALVNGLLSSKFENLGLTTQLLDTVIGGTAELNSTNQYDNYVGFVNFTTAVRDETTLRNEALRLLTIIGKQARAEQSLNFVGGIISETDYFEEYKYWDGDSHSFSLEGRGVNPTVVNESMLFSIPEGSDVSNKDRSELVVNGASQVVDETRCEFSVALGADTITDGADWKTIFQLQQSLAGSPIFSITEEAGNVSIKTRSGEGLSNLITHTTFPADTLPHVYKVILKGGFSNDGYVKVWKDGRIIIDAKGINIGKTHTTDTVPLLIPFGDRAITTKIGVYRAIGSINPATVIVNYCKFQTVMKEWVV